MSGIFNNYFTSFEEDKNLNLYGWMWETSVHFCILIKNMNNKRNRYNNKSICEIASRF